MEMIDRLEQVLVRWETICFLLNCEWKMVSALQQKRMLPIGALESGPAIYAPEFRRYLLETTSDVIDQRFMGSSFVQGSNASWASFPAEILAWTKQSRRVFQLSEELNMLLSLTALDGIIWSEVPWPFSSFAITLEKPIVDHRNIEYDCMLFSTYRSLGGEMMTLRLLPKQMAESYVPSRAEKNRLIKALEKRNADKMVNELESIKKKIDRAAKPQWVTIPKRDLEKELVTTSINKFITYEIDDLGKIKIHPEGLSADVQGYGYFTEAFNIVVGLCFYLQSLGHRRNTHRSDWAPARETHHPDPRAITNEALVCAVSCVHHFSVEEQSARNRFAHAKTERQFVIRQT